MKYVLEFELPGLPKTTNGSHGQWFAAAAERKKWRKAVRMISHFRRPPSPLEKAILFCTRFSSVEPDEDNLAASFKSVIDGLKDALVIVDDKRKVIVSRKYSWEKAKPGEGKIRVRVEEASE